VTASGKETGELKRNVDKYFNKTNKILSFVYATAAAEVMGADAGMGEWYKA
jgi:hypothetical protein